MTVELQALADAVLAEWRQREIPIRTASAAAIRRCRRPAGRGDDRESARTQQRRGTGLGANRLRRRADHPCGPYALSQRKTRGT